LASRRSIALAAGGALLVLVVYPIAMVIYGSLTRGGPADGGPLTLANYGRVASEVWFLPTIRNTLVMTVGALAVSALLGGAAAWVVTQTNASGRRLIAALATMPIVVSSFVLAVGWRLLAAREVGLLNRAAESLVGVQPFDVDTMLGMIFVLGIAHVPQMFLFTSAALERVDAALVEASLVGGAGTLRTILRIAIPVCAPGLLSALLLVVMLNLAALVVPLLLGFSSGTFVMTSQLYVLTDFGNDLGGAAALSVMLLGASLALLTAYWRILGGRSFVTLGGKGFRPYRFDLGRWRWLPAASLAPILAIGVITPILVMAATSLSPYVGAFFPMTMRSYEALLRSSLFATALRNTLIIAVVGPALALALATVLAWLITRSKMRGTRLLELAAMLTLGVPAIVMGFGMLWAWVRVPLLWGSIWILIMALIGAWIAVAVRAVVPAFMQVNPELEESGLTSGTSVLQTVRLVTLPLVLPGVAAAWIILFVLFFRDVPTILMLWRAGAMPMSIYMLQAGMVGDYPSVSALAMLETFLLTAGIIAFRVIIARTGSSRLGREILTQAR
jgi:iron(III) transport system permease protein